MHGTLIPNNAAMIAAFRGAGMEVMFARIACQTKDGRNRSLSQKMHGFNNLLLPKDEHASQIGPAIRQGVQGTRTASTRVTDWLT